MTTITITYIGKVESQRELVGLEPHIWVGVSLVLVVHASVSQEVTDWGAELNHRKNKNDLSNDNALPTRFPGWVSGLP